MWELCAVAMENSHLDDLQWDRFDSHGGQIEFFVAL
jgi:hypothetical protein